MMELSCGFGCGGFLDRNDQGRLTDNSRRESLKRVLSMLESVSRISNLAAGQEQGSEQHEKILTAHRIKSGTRRFEQEGRKWKLYS